MRGGPDAAFPPACVPDDDGRCSICGDEGRVGELLEIPEGGTMGRVRMEDEEPGAGNGSTREEMVALDLLDGAEPGDRLVVHMGFAIARVREEP